MSEGKFEKAITTLEYDKVLKMLSDCAETDGAKLAALSLRPMTNRKNILDAQERTQAAKMLIEKKGAPGFRGVTDVSEAIDRAEKGASLSIKELLNIGKVLSAARLVKDYSATHVTEENILFEMFSRLFPNKFLEESISRSFLSEDTVADEASATLSDIRRRIRAASAKIRENMQKYITSPSYTKYLQENIITMRGGRYVIPVKCENRSEIKGLVHDTSASGATLFIEPMSVVELNNEIKLLENNERHEIERILSVLSSQVAAFAAQIRLNYSNINELALIFAMAELSFKMGAVKPVFSDKNVLKFDRARHPLLDKKKVVPITVYLGEKFDSLIITGPNTGGKTVSIKTVGLLSMMAQTGLQIPCDDGSVCAVFDDVLADIGDEQSIEQSLSTFSAHMVNIIDILAKCTNKSLVLIDELGAGTDPIEGAALAVSIIERIREKGSLVAATTHYAEMKAYALETEGVENASCEFDVESLRPTYKLNIGTPGRSNAFLISEKLGLDMSIIKRAGGYVDGETRHFENLIGELEDKRVEMEKMNAEARQHVIDTNAMKESAAAQREKLLEGAQKEYDRARTEATRLVAAARRISEQVLGELEELKKKKEKEDFAKQFEKAKEDIRRNLKTMENNLGYKEFGEEEEYNLPRPLRPGDTVIIAGMNKEATVEKISGETATLKVGAKTMKIKVSSLRLVTGFKSGKKKTGVTRMSPRPNVKAEIDLRGQYGDDAWFMVDKYLDDAALAGLHSVSLIHGKGTGALRAALWKYLRSDKRIKDFRLGTFGEGDSGVTIVELK